MMGWQLDPYGMFALGAGLVSCVVALYAWRHRATAGMMPVIAFLGAAVWSMGYAAALGSEQLSQRILWAKVQHIGIAVIPIAMLIFVLQYTGRSHKLNLVTLPVLAAIPGLGLILVWTNEWHGLIWRSIALDLTGPVATLVLEYGYFFYLYIAFNYLALLVSLALLLQAFRTSQGLRRAQTASIFIAILFPAVFNLLYLLGYSPVPNLDLTPFSYSITGAIFLWSLMRYRLLDLVPVARNALLEMMVEGVIVVDIYNRIVDANPSALQLLDLGEKDVLGVPAVDLFARRLQLKIDLSPTAEANQEIVLGQGEAARYFDLHITPILNIYQRRSGYLLVFHEITQRINNEKELVQAKETAVAANRAKTNFLAAMSHELRTPLSTILGFNELLARSPHTSPDQLDSLETINQASEHLLALINNVLDISKIEAGKQEVRLETFDLHWLLVGMEEMFRLRAAAKGLDLFFEINPNSPRLVRSDQEKLRQVLFNLVSNAIKFTEKGGVTLRASQLPHEWNLLEDGSTSFYLHFEVEDTGIGIAAEHIPRLFDAFNRSGASEYQFGTGLGLTIALRNVRLLGGDITVYSQPGAGSTFLFDIMAQLPSEAELEDQLLANNRKSIRPFEGQCAPDGGPYRFLIVDDAEHARLLLQKIFEPMGFEIRHASNGQEAVAVWKEWLPHMVWMDLLMPIMDGQTAACQIKELSAGLPPEQCPVIVAMTASVFEEERARVHEHACDEFLRKPFREVELVQIIKRRLGIQFEFEGERELQQLRSPILDRSKAQSEPPQLSRQWLDNLEQAATAGDLDRVIELAHQIQSTSPTISESLVRHAENYDLRAIQRFLDTYGMVG